MLSIATLREHAPFDEMDDGSLAFLASRAALAYYARGSEIAGPDSGVADRLFIVKQGRVQGNDAVLGPGECFPIGALLGRRATTHPWKAEADTFCWELPAEDFHALMARSPQFQASCTGYLAALVERSYRAMRAEASGSLTDAAGMLAPLRSALARTPVSCLPVTPVREVLKVMHEKRVGSMVVVDAANAPVGIFTRVDVLGRVAAPQAPVDGPISALMTPDPLALEEDATLADAAIAMARHGIRHVVVTRDGKLAGVVSERDLFALHRLSLRRVSEDIRSADRLAEVVEAAQEVRALAGQLLAHGVAPEQLTAMVSALNDAVTQKMISLSSALHPAQARWCWLALGSEGRMEQTFVSDQDNALIFATESVAEAARRELLAFAGEVNRNLDEAGFPLCKGGIMAGNPRWCLAAEEWRAVFEGWIRNPQPEALLNASIFFDFRALAGEARLAADLREGVLEQARRNRIFLRAMTEAALQTTPPVGLVRDFLADELDLKGTGTRLFVDAARVLALAHGRAETGTAARLRATGASSALPAFHFIQGLRLRHGNHLRVAALSAVDRRILKEALREAALLQSRIRLDFKL